MFFSMSRLTIRRLTILCTGILAGIVLQILSLFVVRFLTKNHRLIFTQRVYSMEEQGTANPKELLERIPQTSPLSVQKILPTPEEIPAYITYATADLTTRQIIAGRNEQTPKAIASLTKVMTAIVTQDLVPDQMLLEVTPYAAEQIPTKLGLRPGEQLQVEELLAASLLTSANDAAQVIADGIEQHYPGVTFAELMNHKADVLHLTSTRFSNPQGFDSPSNKSTAHDLLQLTSYLWSHYPVLRDLAAKDQVQAEKTIWHKQYDFKNWNGLIGVYPGAMGLKIGNTDQAGKTIIAVAEREGKTIAVVVLGAQSVTERDIVAAALLDQAFASLYGLPPANISEAMLIAKYQSWNTRS
jgi:D-alanyl-D-alanine carboxypeptidase